MQGTDGINGILSALALGGQPTGQIANLPNPLTPQANAVPPAGGGQAGTIPSGVAGAPAAMPDALMTQGGQGADPLTELLMANPEQAQMIIQALMGGAFNQNPDPLAGQ